MSLTYSVDSSGYKELIRNSYDMMINNIINDTTGNFEVSDDCEMFKQEFFNYLDSFDPSVNEIVSFCKSFFYFPAHETLRKRRYLLKGRKVHSPDNLKLGRLVKKEGLLNVLQEAIDDLSLRTTGTIDSAVFDEKFLESFLHDYTLFKHKSSSSSSFIEYINDRGLSEEKIGNYPMWSFENVFDENPFELYSLEDLPCILGIPDNNGKADNFKIDCEASKFCVFELSISDDILIKHPNSFDAGVNNMWQAGGKTKVHDECKAKYGTDGFHEFIHEPIKFKQINSELFTL